MITLVHRRNDHYTKTVQQNLAKIDNAKNENNFTLFPLTLPFGRQYVDPEEIETAIFVHCLQARFHEQLISKIVMKDRLKGNY